MRVELRFDERDFHLEILLREFLPEFDFLIPGDETAHDERDPAVNRGDQEKARRERGKFARVRENYLLESEKDERQKRAAERRGAADERSANDQR